MMYRNRIETDDINESQITEEGPSSGMRSWNRGIDRHHVNPVNRIRQKKWSSQENKIVMECYILSEPKIRVYRKSMLVYGLVRVCLEYQNNN